MVASIAVVGMDDETKMALLVDEINAYSFLYPVESPSKKFVFKWYALFCFEMNTQFCIFIEMMMMILAFVILERIF